MDGIVREPVHMVPPFPHTISGGACTNKGVIPVLEIGGRLPEDRNMV